MTYEQAIRHYGMQKVLAAALRLDQSTVSCWGKVIPDRYQYQLEVITEGKLRVDRRLRGDAQRKRLGRTKQTGYHPPQ